MVEVVGTDEFRDWYRSLMEAEQEDVNYSVDLLEQMGLTLGSPHSSDIKGARYSMRELRIQSHGDPLRILYKFDPLRQAVLLIGADKTGDDRFYKVFVPRAEKLWEEYLDETGQAKKERRKR